MISFKGLALYRVQPPYTTFQRVHTVSRLNAGDTVAGAILVIDVPRGHGRDSVLSDVIPQLRSRFPVRPLLLRIHSTEDAKSGLLGAVRRAGELHVRAVFTHTEPFPAVVRPVLTAPADLPDDVLEWLNVRGHTLSPRTKHLIGGIFTHATNWSRIGPLLDSIIRISQRSARELCSDRGLPPPSGWLQVARAIHAMLRLQADRGTSVYDAAISAGYTDEKTLGRQTVRFFEIRPGEARGTLGWEWLLERFLVRHAPLAGINSPN